MGSHPYRTTSGYAWASINRLAYFIFVAIGGTALHNQREEMHARLRAMQRAQALEHEIVRVSEREQMRIGQDLHDGLCQQLAAIDCAAACLKADLETEERPEARAADTIQQMLRDAMLEARSLARGISPVHSDADDLPAVLEELAEKTNQAGVAATTFIQTGDVQRLEPQTALHLYRIAQEAVRNALKHAEASRIEIELQGSPSLKVSVADNGRGFAVRPSSKGMGVGTMRYRARLIGADLRITQRDGGGTLVTCTLPSHVLTGAETSQT
jgi:signal transduction histidine kinase